MSDVQQTDDNLSIVARIKRGEVDHVTDILLTEMPSPEEIHLQEQNDGDALFWSACRGYSLIVELLLMLGANVNKKSLASGATALHAAADNGQDDVIKILLNWGSDVFARNHFLDTACHLAAFRGHSRCVALLLKAGSDTSLKNSRQNTVFDEARYGQLVLNTGQHTVIKHLLYSYENSTTRNDVSLASTGNYSEEESDHHHDHYVMAIDLTRENKLRTTTNFRQQSRDRADNSKPA